MKKNRKKYSLNELLSSMEHVGQQDQQAAVGGVHVFSSDGSYRGKIGMNNDIRINPGSSCAGLDEMAVYNVTVPYSSTHAGVKQSVI